MMGRVVTVGWISGSIWFALCQTTLSGALCQQNFPDTALDSFLRQVAQLGQSAGPVLLNGVPSELRQPSARDAIGLTERESQILTAVAADYQAKVRLLDKVEGPLVLEARLLTLAGEQISDSAKQRIQELVQARRQMLADHINQLRAGFNPLRLQVICGYIQSHENAPRYFPAETARE